MKLAIKSILLAYPMDKRFTTAQLRQLLSLKLGYWPDAGEVTRACRELIEAKELNLCHIFENKKWRYLSSVKHHVLLKHNIHLHRDQMNKEIRKKDLVVS